MAELLYVDVYVRTFVAPPARLISFKSQHQRSSTSTPLFSGAGREGVKVKQNGGTARVESTACTKQYTSAMPFHGQDAWRRHPLFTNLWKDPLPGFRPAVIVFGIYLVGDYGYRWMNYQMNAPKHVKGGGH